MPRAHRGSSNVIEESTLWRRSHRFDSAVLPLVDRHYNRQKPGTSQFVPPGRCLVLHSVDRLSLWVTSWPYTEFTKHAWAGAWINSLFRREGGPLASDLIRDAVACTVGHYGAPPPTGHGDLRRRLEGAPQARSGSLLSARRVLSRRYDQRRTAGVSDAPQGHARAAQRTRSLSTSSLVGAP